MEPSVFESVYEAILRRDAIFDGRYYVGIVTTGIYCRPSCRSRTPKRENVKVYGSAHEASEAGFRPCKRCRPDRPGPNGPDADMAAAVSAMIAERYRERLTLASMAKQLNLSPFHLQRVFKRTTGTTPARRLLQVRLDQAKALLLGSDLTITEIAASCGFGSVSHFSASFRKESGRSPQHYRRAATSELHFDAGVDIR